MPLSSAPKKAAHASFIRDQIKKTSDESSVMGLLHLTQEIVVDEASKAVVAIGKPAFLTQAPDATPRWKDRSGSTDARNKTKTAVIRKLKRKAGIAEACAEAE